MIREKAIFIKLNQLHFSDQQIFDQAVSGFNPAKCPCPNCKAVGWFRQIQPYERFLISVEGGRRCDASVLVPRFQCESCGRTHAVLPDVLIPFGSYSLRFVLTVLAAYLKRSSTVAGLCEYWQISVSTLYAWIHLFDEHYNAWCGVLERIRWICQKALEAVSSAEAFPGVFFSRFAFSFLQRCRSASPSVPELHYDRRRRSCCT